MKRLNAVVTRILDVLAWLAMTLIGLATIAVAVSIFTRYFLNKPIWWVPEATQYALGFITLLGAAWVLKREGHVRMDLVLEQLSHRVRDWINVVTSILCAVLCLIITWRGMVVVWDYYQIDYIYEGSLVIPVFLLEGVIPVGFFLLSIQFLRRANGYFGRLRTSSK